RLRRPQLRPPRLRERPRYRGALPAHLRPAGRQRRRPLPPEQLPGDLPALRALLGQRPVLRLTRGRAIDEGAPRAEARGAPSPSVGRGAPDGLGPLYALCTMSFPWDIGAW